MLDFELTPRVRQLVILTACFSIAGGIAWSWMDLPVVEWFGLTPRALVGMSDALPGIPAIWQVATFPLFAFGPLDLVLSVLTYGWFAGDLERAWGSRLFGDRWVMLVLAIAGVTSLGAIFYPPLRDATVFGPSPVLEGLVVAWGTTFPDRRIRIWWIFPVTGRLMVWITVALLGLSVVFGGPMTIPFLLAPITAVALGIWMGRSNISLRRIGLRFQRWRLERQMKRSMHDDDRTIN